MHFLGVDYNFKMQRYTQKRLGGWQGPKRKTKYSLFKNVIHTTTHLWTMPSIVVYKQNVWTLKSYEWHFPDISRESHRILCSHKNRITNDLMTYIFVLFRCGGFWRFLARAYYFLQVNRSLFTLVITECLLTDMSKCNKEIFKKNPRKWRPIQGIFISAFSLYCFFLVLRVKCLPL